MKWLDAMMKEAKSIDPEKFRPTGDIGPGNSVVGEVSEQQKHLYALAKKYERNAEKIASEAMTALFLTRPSKAVLMERTKAEKHKACVLLAVFYASIRDEYDLWSENIDIKKGWKIVRVRIDEIPNIRRFDFNATLDPRHH